MAKDQTKKTIDVDEALDANTTRKAEEVTFSEEQIKIVNQLIEKAVSSSTKETDNSISVYGMRDPKKIETVNVKRFDGKFVIGFKNIQNDPMKDTPKYVEYKFDAIRKKDRQPYVTLLLSDDGVNVEEREILLVDYMQGREKYETPVKEILVDETIENHGLLGKSDMARNIDEKGNVIPRAAIRAESKRIVKEFVVELPGFEKPITFKEDFLA